jgi:hypothetical protein
MLEAMKRDSQAELERVERDLLTAAWAAVASEVARVRQNPQLEREVLLLLVKNFPAARTVYQRDKVWHNMFGSCVSTHRLHADARHRQTVSGGRTEPSVIVGTVRLAHFGTHPFVKKQNTHTFFTNTFPPSPLPTVYPQFDYRPYFWKSHGRLSTSST